MTVDDPDFWYIVTYADGRISKCYNWFQAYNELANPGASGSIKHYGYVIVSRTPAGKWEWSTQPNRERGFDLEVET